MKKILLAMLVAGAIQPALADDFTDTLESARQAYSEGDIAGAREEVAYASQLLAQMRAGQLESLLPEALDGWEKKVSEGNANAGMAMFGGGTTANATYRRDRKQVKVSIVTDSPMLATMSAMFGNPAMAGAQGTMKRINRQKVLVKPDGSITAMIDKRVMVEVSGSADAQAKEDYFKAIDFKALEAY